MTEKFQLRNEREVFVNDILIDTLPELIKPVIDSRLEICSYGSELKVLQYKLVVSQDNKMFMVYADYGGIYFILPNKDTIIECHVFIHDSHGKIVKDKIMYRCPYRARPLVQFYNNYLFIHTDESKLQMYDTNGNFVKNVNYPYEMVDQMYPISNKYFILTCWI